MVVHEIDRHGADDRDGLLATIRAAIVETHEVDPCAIVLVSPAGVPKTSSGKVQRSACRKAFLEGSLPVVAEWRAPELSALAEAASAGALEDPAYGVAASGSRPQDAVPPGAAGLH